MNNLEIPETLSAESLEAIRNALHEIQSDREQTAVFLDEMLNGMESVRQQIESHEVALRERRDHLNRREVDMRRTLQELEERAIELASCEDDLHAARRTIADLEEHIGELEEERDTARQRLDAAADELASVADVLSVLDTTQRELVAAREQIVMLQEQVQPGRSEADDAMLQQALREKEQLESELRKSKEEIQRLNERVCAQTDELSSLRARWSGDLGSMRDRLMERAKGIKETADKLPVDRERSSRTTEPQDPTKTEDALPETEAAARDQAGTDSVIGSVLAQLADLQDD